MESKSVVLTLSDEQLSFVDQACAGVSAKSRAEFCRRAILEASSAVVGAEPPAGSPRAGRRSALSDAARAAGFATVREYERAAACEKAGIPYVPKAAE